MESNQNENRALQTVVDDTPESTGRISAGSLMLDSDTMGTLMRVADLMAGGKSTVPLHLQKNPSDCMAVCTQAMQWGMNPFAVAQKTHIVNGTLGYEAQLVNAVVQQSGAIVGRFHYEYKGDSPQINCRVGAVIRGEVDITWGEWLHEGKVTTKNSPLWKTNPKQQMGYLQVKNWARLYAPGALLGVYTPDELDQPLPRNMGHANEVPTESYVATSELEASARKAASEGKASFAAFFNGLPKADRPHLRSLRAELDQIATDADAARTVETPAASTTNQSTGEVTVTFAQVIAKLDMADNEDKLYVAYDWANAMDDQTRMAEVEAHFNARLTTIRGE